ncbi:hypothetical protein ACOTI1_24250 [Achromobacter xylosoxidans]
MTQQDDITRRLRDNADLDEAEHGNARVVQLERDAADEIERLRAPVADERALDLLDTLFTAYENGTPCYEEPDSQGGYLGMAFRIDDDTFRACADLLNKERPRTAGALASAPVAGEAVYTLSVKGVFHNWKPTTAAFSIPDGEHQLFLRPAAPQVSECECSRKSKAVSDSEAQL